MVTQKNQPFVLEEARIASIHSAFRSGELTAVQLVSMYLQRIEAFDQQGPKLNAVITLNPHILAEAEQLDKQWQASGMTGPLHGIPVLLKDNVNTTALATTAGSLSLKNFYPPADAFIVNKLRTAGALILAKVNLHEFAIWGESVSSMLGQTVNPYDLSRTPGGSSGGTGTALAANYGVLGVGTDTVNSVRSPASANSVVGLRPTLGLISRTGIIPYSYTQDTAGPMARTVEDTARMLNCLTGYDLCDPVTKQSEEHIEPDYTQFLHINGLEKKKIGVLRSFWGGNEIHLEVNSICEAALQSLQDLGASLVELNLELKAEDVLSASVHLMELDSHLSGYLANPLNQMPVHSLTQILESGAFHPSIESNLREALSLRFQTAAYQERLNQQARLRKILASVMEDYQLDALVFPHQKRLVAPIGEQQLERNGTLAAVTGFPSLVVPAGFSAPTQSSPIGVPVGIEFVALPWQEGLLLQIGYAFEQGTRHRKEPPFAPALSSFNY